MSLGFPGQIIDFKNRGIEKPEDLVGKAITTPGYSSTSLRWIGGMLQDEHGVKPQDIEWIIASKNSPAKVSGNVSKQRSYWHELEPTIRSSHNRPNSAEVTWLLGEGSYTLFTSAQLVPGHAL